MVSLVSDGALLDEASNRSATTAHDSAREGVRRLLRDASRHYLSLLLDNPGIAFFESGAGVVGYARYRSSLLVLGGLMAPEPERPGLLAAFIAWCDRERLNPMFVHTPEADLPLLRAAGFEINQIGACYGIHLPEYSMAGKRFQQLRNKINRARKKGLVVEEITRQQDFEALLPVLRAINHSWLHGKKAKHIRFMVTDFDYVELGPDANRLLVARHDGEVIGYILYSRTWGDDSGWFHNLSRHRVGSVDGSMQLINHTFLESLDSDIDYLHFGFTPLVEMTGDAPDGSKAFAAVASFLAQRGGVVYPARSQRQYKMSWRPTYIRPEYFAYRGSSLKALLGLLFATNSV